MIFLDTHVVVWLYAGLVTKLSKDAIELIEANNLQISQMVRLELQYLYEIKRITVPPDMILTGLARSIGLKISDGLHSSAFDQALEYAWTRDVFDRLIVAEASASEAVLISKDRKIRDQYTRAVW